MYGTIPDETTGSTRIIIGKIGNHYSPAFLSPKIYVLQFKFILHARFVPTWLLEDHEDMGCRLKCGCRKESVEHLAVCPALLPLRTKLAVGPDGGGAVRHERPHLSDR